MGTKNHIFPDVRWNVLLFGNVHAGNRAGDTFFHSSALLRPISISEVIGPWGSEVGSGGPGAS